jgi:hypothetical protein
MATGIAHSRRRILPACACLVGLPQLLVGVAEVIQGLVKPLSFSCG